MNKQEQIAWLKRFIEIWEADIDEVHIDWLCDIYGRFCEKENLPLWSAEDNVYNLSS